MGPGKISQTKVISSYLTGPKAGLHESLQPCSRAARKWRENEEMKRKWRENEEIERKWGENEEMERESGNGEREISSLSISSFSL